MTVPNELILLVLRLVSGLLLLAILLALFRLLWKEFRNTDANFELERQRYGSLVMIRSINDQNMITGESYPLMPITSLGRAPTNSIVLTDTFASSDHAVVSLKNGQWWLEDRDSRNGTLLNGRPVTQPTVITRGDIIGIGQVRFRLDVDA